MTAIALPPVLAGRYEVEEELGAGGMASVWRATDRVLGRPVAVKVLHGHLAEKPSSVERFQREAVSSARLAHPNIVNVFDTGEEEGVSYIVMEHFAGETLSDLLDRHGSLDVHRAVDIELQVLAALAAAHEAGTIHCDVKPGNILVAEDGRIKVTDFGIAKAMYLDGADVTSTGSVLGSVPYLSPEQVQGGELDGRSDLYAAGVVLYEMLTGRRPFSAPTDLATAMMRLTTQPLAPRACRAGIPKAVEGVVLRAMAVRPDDRYASAEEMAAALARFRRERTGSLPAGLSSGGGADPPGAREPAGSWFRAWMLVPLLVVLAGALLIGAGLVAGVLEVGGPLGIQPADEDGALDSPGQAPRYRPASVVDFDPFGTAGENPDLLPLATDRDPATHWETESYDLNHEARPTGLLVASQGVDKPGVGLLVDLGESREVAGLILRTPFPGWRFELRVGDDPEELVAREPAEEPLTARPITRVILDDPVEGRYVLVWAMSVVGAEDGHRATVAELAVMGPGT
jgi:eukaryotic-like serine/threonine-protein kinase